MSPQDRGPGLPEDEVLAAALLRSHLGRRAQGRLEDPAVLAAVVGVERMSLTHNTQDPVELGALLDRVVAGRSAGRVATTAQDLLVTEVLSSVTSGVRRGHEGRSADAGVLDPDAGRHPISCDARLLRAGVRAAHGSRARMPYYAARYGARGARRAISDAAWLVSLVGLLDAEGAAQVTWLAGLLAARGMPSWLLERQLEDLVAEVVLERGHDGAGCLPTAADVLRERRRAVLDDDVLADSDRRLDAVLGELTPVPHAGALLAAGVADVRSGLVETDASLVDWLTDPVRADAEVVAAVEDLRTSLG